jgi:hypothetical protein
MQKLPVETFPQDTRHAAAMMQDDVELAARLQGRLGRSRPDPHHVTTLPASLSASITSKPGPQTEILRKGRAVFIRDWVEPSILPLSLKPYQIKCRFAQVGYQPVGLSLPTSENGSDYRRCDQRMILRRRSTRTVDGHCQILNGDASSASEKNTICPFPTKFSNGT